MTEVVSALHLSKRYGKASAVADVSLSVAEGEIVCLLGPNGAGKSTVVRMLATLTRPDGGSATVAGYDVSAQPRSVRAHVGYIAQQAGTDGHLTGRENLLSQAAAQGIRRSAAIGRVTELLAMVDLSHAANRLVRTYSGGMRRRLEIAMGLVHQPEIIFLDEPTTGLDPEARSRLWQDIEGLATRQTLSVLLTTHYLDEADRLADRIVIINHGRVVVTGTPTQLKATVAGDALTLELAHVHRPDAVMAIAHRLGARMIRLDGSTLHATVDDGERAMPAMVTGLHASGYPVESAAVSRPSLDDVYRHYTGHAFTVDEDDHLLETVNS